MIQASYPQEAWRLSQSIDSRTVNGHEVEFSVGDGLLVQMKRHLSAVPDEVVKAAVSDLCLMQKRLPSLADILNQVALIQRQHAKRQKQELLPPPDKEEAAREYAILMQRLADFRERKNGNRNCAPDTSRVADELREYARKYFPEMEDETIARNFCTLDMLMKNDANRWDRFAAAEEGKPPWVRMYPRLNKTGVITPVVYYDEDMKARYERLVRSVKREQTKGAGIHE